MVMVDAEFIRQEGRFARQERVAAPGIPPGTTNYPGAVAQPRPPASTGFRGVESGGVVGSDPNPLNINAPVLQDTYNAGVIQPNSRLYLTQDANWNTTAVIGYNSTTQTWQVVQRYVYSPYGNISILNPDFTTVPTGTQPLVNNPYQGMALDPVTGLYYERARWYRTGQAGLRQDPKSSRRIGTGAVHREVSQDPLQYINGANTYQFVMSNPVRAVDPWGLKIMALVSGPNPTPSGWLDYYARWAMRIARDMKASYTNAEDEKIQKAGKVTLDGAAFTGSRQDIINAMLREARSKQTDFTAGGRAAMEASAKILAGQNKKKYDWTLAVFHGVYQQGTNKPLGFVDINNHYYREPANVAAFQNIIGHVPGQPLVVACFTNGNLEEAMQVVENSGNLGSCDIIITLGRVKVTTHPLAPTTQPTRPGM